MKKLLSILLLTLPLTVLAQNAAPSAANVPVIIVDQGNKLGVQPAPQNARPVPGGEFPNFPENAITRVGENTTGQHVDAPAAAPAAPGAPVPASGATTATPASPTPPPSPVAKLWPRDTRQIFMVPCVGFHEEFIIPCNCVINRLIETMPHDEFLRESDAGTIEQDPRLTKIRTDCASMPQPHKD